MELFINSWILKPLIATVNYIAGVHYGFYYLIAALIILSIIQGKITPKPGVEKPPPITETRFSKYLKFAPKILNFSTICLVLLIFSVGYVKFGPAIIDFFKVSDTKTEQKKTTPAKTPATNGSEDKVETQGITPGTTTPTYEAPKQLYYAVSCSTCWNDACTHDGYSYGGYSDYYYTYYYSLCKSCSCNSFNATSFWK
jgi:hypothetical protein